MIKEPIVITGAGVVSAIGVGKAQTLSALCSYRTGIEEVKYLQTEHHELPVGEVKLSNAEMQQLVQVPADGDEPLSRTTLMARLAMREALSEAGLLDAQYQLLAGINGTMPLISGTTVGGMDRGENLFTSTEHEAMMQQMQAAQSDCGSNTHQIASGFGQFALLDTLSTACSSAANAIEIGANLLKTGRFARAVVGGTESLSRFHLNGFNTLMILDHELCRPFDATRAGLNLGEGAAYLVIETLSSALGRGAKPLAVLSGYGNACDAYHQTASSADGEGAYLAMKQAIDMAGLQPADIDYVNAHGTGTPNNDPSELAAMHRLFGQDSPLPPYSSTKGFTGHTTSASGSIEAVFCLLALQHQFLPVSLNCKEPIEGEPAPVSMSAPASVSMDSLASMGIDKPALVSMDKPASVRPIHHILCNAFGFGGNDSSLLLSHAETLSERLKQGTLSQYEASPVFENANLDSKKVFIVAQNKLSAVDEDPDFKKYMSSGEARRLGPMLKRTLAVSIQTLRDAGKAFRDAGLAFSEVGTPEQGVEDRPFVPDAIITGTAWGNAESSEVFLRDMLTGGEQLLKPTPFMQSTHNTIGSLIAISTKNHGYNNTHSQGADSLRMAMLDAWMLMQLGMIRSALVGWHDFVPERVNEALLLVSEDALGDVQPIGEVKFEEI